MCTRYLLALLSQRRTTEDGHELTLATNHLGHHLLTTLLLPCLAAEPLGRVAVLTSSLHRKVVDFETAMGDMQTEHSYSLFKAYVNREQRAESREQRAENIRITER